MSCFYKIIFKSRFYCSYFTTRIELIAVGEVESINDDTHRINDDTQKIK
jgi:hypothetical protein